MEGSASPVRVVAHTAIVRVSTYGMSLIPSSESLEGVSEVMAVLTPFLEGWRVEDMKIKRGRIEIQVILNRAPGEALQDPEELAATLRGAVEQLAAKQGAG